MNINIRKAGQSDKQLIKDTMLKALIADPTAFTSSYEEYNSASRSWWDSYISPYTRGFSTKLYFAETNGDTVGMIGIIKNTRSRMKHVASIVWFWVDKSYRKKGIGKMLLNELISNAKKDTGLKKLHLTVTSAQTSAISLYKTYGFRIVGTQVNELFIDGEFYDFMTMEKFIHQIG